ncbi:hypothetical protein [Kitasatospora sp. NPDC059160]|uniref:hypothetical protein n=1 Tax=Kitasatospora sp. NPDC059160 TaxID=3346748 RepID=UPI0036C0AC9A
MMTAEPPEPLSANLPHLADVLLGPLTFDSVVSTVLDNNQGLGVPMARRITREAIAFVVTGALRRDIAIVPSRIVDEGWHALIQHTEAYADLCARFGDFVHHSPGYGTENYDPNILRHTQAAIRAVGFDIDLDLWRAPDDDSLVTVAAGCQHAPAKDGPIKPMPKPEHPCHKPKVA